MRTIEFTFPQPDLSTAIGDAGIPITKFFDAIGYLSTWGVGGYDSLSLHVQSDGEVIAVYTESTKPEKKYVIGAIWHGEHYGFHS